jgi:HEAT repeat protein
VEVTLYRSEAINALAKQRDSRAVPVLRQILNEVEDWQRHLIVKALLESGGYTIPEQIEALEYFAKNAPKEATEMP